MEDKVKEMLDEEIKAQINIVAASKSGTQERADAIEDLKGLYKLRIDEEKLSLDEKKMKADDQKESNRIEIDKERLKIDEKKLKIDEERLKIEDQKESNRLRIEEEKLSLEHQKLDKEDKCENDKRFVETREKIVKLVISGAEIVLPLIFYGVWMSRGFRFEETGSFTSTTFRNLINRFKPTK